MSAQLEKIRLKYFAPSVRKILPSRPEGMRYLGLENIESGTGRLLLDTEQEQVDSSVVTFDERSVLFGKLRPYLAKVAIPDFSGVASTEIMVLEAANDNDRRFLAYSLLSDEFIKRVSGMTDGAKMPRANPDDVLNLRMYAPEPSDQSRIATYLDEQTAKIDRLLDMRRRQMELLKEQRVSLVQQAVTRGINLTVSTRDSRIPWLGEIPSHWKKTKLLRIACRGRGMFVNGPFGSDLLTSELTDTGVPVIYIRDIKAQGYCWVSEVCVTAEKAASLNVFRVDSGDIVVAKVGNPPGTAAVYPEEEPSGIVTQDVIRIKSDPRCVNAAFIVYWLNSSAGQASIDQISVESTRMRVDLESYKSLRIWLPPLDEQQEILDFIRQKTATIDATVSSYTRQLTLLAEYRAALIHECVTGHREV